MEAKLIKSDKLSDPEQSIPKLTTIFWNLTNVSVPIFSQQLLRFLQVVCNYRFVSWIDDVSVLGGLGLALCFFAVCLQALLLGLNSAVTISVPQLIGLGKVEETGRWLNAGRIVNTMFGIPLTLMLLFSYKMLIFFGQEEQIAYNASQFLEGLVPCVWFLAQGNLTMYYLNSFKMTRPGMISSVGGLLIQIAFNYVFYIKMGLGLFSGGISASIQNFFQCIFLFTCLFYYPETRSSLHWPKFDRVQLEYVKDFLKVGIPSLLISCLYILGVEIMQPLAGLISPLSNGAQGIVMNIYYGLFTVYIGVSMATSIFVGNAIGEGNVVLARLYAKASIFLILIITFVMVVTITIWKSFIVSFYTSNEEIKASAESALGIFCFAIVPDSILFSQGGALRGLGKQLILILVQIICTFGISVPIGVYCAFNLEMGIKGFWIGYSIRSIISCIIAQYIMWYYLNWEKIAADLKKNHDIIEQERLRMEQEDIQMLDKAEETLIKEEGLSNSNYGSINYSQDTGSSSGKHKNELV